MVASESPPATYGVDAQRADLTRLYNLMRDCLLSKKYYAAELHTQQARLKAADIISALASSSVVAGIVIWKTGPGVWVYTGIATAAAVLTALKPVLGLPALIERYSGLYAEYQSLYLDMDMFVARARRAGHLTEEMSERCQALQERYKALSQRDDACPDQKRLQKFQAEVKRQIPAEQLWLPQE